MICHSSVKGVRPTNEDNHNIFIQNNKTYCCLYDGHGSKVISKYLSEIMPKYATTMINTPFTIKNVKATFDAIQKDVETKPESKDFGSTCIMTCIYKLNNQKCLDIINLGDCKVVLCKKNKVVALTTEHRPMMIEEHKRITKLGGKITFDGVDWRIGGYSVSRSFGDVCAKPYMSHIPDVYNYKIASEDRFLIIGCDGLWDYVSELDATTFVLSHAYKDNKLDKTTIETIAKKLCRFALNKGSLDNVSVIIVFFK